MNRVEDNKHIAETGISEHVSASASPARFTYQPLDRTSSFIRLLQVLPARRDGKIRVRICHSDTSEHYTCLSYAWGEPGEGFELYVDGHPMRVRRNLYCFLDVASRRYS